MKRLIIATMLLIPTTGFCLSGSKINAKTQELANQQYEIQKAEQAKANAEAQAQANEAQKKKESDFDEYKRLNGAGWTNTALAIGAIYNKVSDTNPVNRILACYDNTRPMSKSEADDCLGMMMSFNQGGAGVLPGIKMTNANWSAHVPLGNETVEIANHVLLSYEIKDSDELTKKYTWGNGIATYQLSDGVNKVIAKINMVEPKKSRITNISLPIDISSSITRKYDKEGVNITPKKLMNMVEDWYVFEMQPAGVSFQDAMIGLLTDMDIKDKFLQFAINHKPAKK